MVGTKSSQGMRRSTRLALAIPVEVSGKDASGKDVREKTKTRLINKHGAMVALRHRFKIGSEVTLRVPHLSRQRECRVAWIGGDPKKQGKYETGLELLRVENLWEIQFPPEDWTARKAAGRPARAKRG